jgi:hypothetical protein
VITRFLCKEDVSVQDIHLRLETQFEENVNRRVMPGDGAGMFGKNVKINMTERDAAEHQSSSLTSEFWCC